jgi:TonB family protein
MASRRRQILLFATVACLTAGSVITAAGQRLAVIEPLKTDGRFVRGFTEAMAKTATVLDRDMASAAFRGVGIADPFNMSADEARSIGSAIGCDGYIVIRTDTLRRSAFGRPEYYESYAAVYGVSSRTGRLVTFRLLTRDADDREKSIEMLTATAPAAVEIAAEMKAALIAEAESPSIGNAEVLIDVDPQPGSRTAVPYKRIRPEYTQEAFLFDVTATVDVLVELAADGRIIRADVVRWAGYGLDGSAAKAIRSMNWRPAERNGKTLPARFLVRYNFKRIEKPK